MEVMYKCDDARERKLRLDGFAPHYVQHLRDDVPCQECREKGMKENRVGIKAQEEAWKKEGRLLLTLSGEGANPQPAKRDIPREAKRIVAEAVNRWKAEVNEHANTTPDARIETQAPIEFQQREAETGGAFDPESEDDARERIDRSIVLRRGQAKFREALLQAYQGKCAVTGFDADEALEAAHIRPYKGPDWNHPTNGLLLRSDVHTLFDRHLIAVDTANMSIRLANSLSGTKYGNLEGRRLRTPKDEKTYGPNREALDLHRAEADL